MLSNGGTANIPCEAEDFEPVLREAQELASSSSFPRPLWHRCGIAAKSLRGRSMTQVDNSKEIATLPDSEVGLSEGYSSHS